MSVSPIRAVGMVWYELDDYPRILAVMEDAHKLPQTFTQWRLSAEQGEKQLLRQGYLVVRAHLNADDFVAWCAARGLNVDAKARMEFANAAAYEKYSKGH